MRAKYFISLLPTIYCHGYIRTRSTLEVKLETVFRDSCMASCGSSAPVPEEWTEFTTTCSCSDDCKNNLYSTTEKSGYDSSPIMCCPDYRTVCDNKQSWKTYDGSQEKPTCPPRSKTPLILISVDGYRAKYLQLNEANSKVVTKLQSLGVKTPYMRASYPSVTFPNHWSIVTGLYTESHGIIANSFSVPEEQLAWSAFDGKQDGHVYGGQPIWETLQSQGGSAATYFWPGSDKNVNGKYPNYYYNYTDKSPYEHRVQQVLKWIDMEDGPDFMAMYFDEPDHTGHGEGPASSEVDDEIKIVNDNIDMLMEGLNARGLFDCVNVIINSDHGMAAVGQENKVSIDDYTNQCQSSRSYGAYCYGGTQARIGPSFGYYGTKFNEDRVWEELKCARHDIDNPAPMYAYKKRFDLPKKFHFAANTRIEPILLEGESGKYVSFEKTNMLEGNHGWDPSNPDMHAISVLHGPGFKNTETDHVYQNIELYAMMCHLLDIQPANTNHTSGSMNHVLAETNQMTVELDPVQEIEEGYLSARNNITEKCGCDNAEAENDELLKIEFSTDIKKNIPGSSLEKYQKLYPFESYYQVNTNLGGDRFTLLTYYEITKEMSGSVELSDVMDIPSFCLRNDIRQVSTYDRCPESRNQMFYFNPAWNEMSHFYENLMNLDQHDETFPRLWQIITTKFFKVWAEEQSLKVWTGPIYDTDFNGLPDDFLASSPTHFYLVLERENGEMASYAIPNYRTEISCNLDWTQSWEQQAIELLKTHATRVRDIELLTGFSWQFGKTDVDSIQRRLKLPVKMFFKH